MKKSLIATLLLSGSLLLTSCGDIDIKKIASVILDDSSSSAQPSESSQVAPGESSQPSTPTPSSEPSSAPSSDPSSQAPVGGITLKLWVAEAEKPVVDAVVAEYNQGKPDDQKIVVDVTAVEESDAGKEVAKNPSAETAPDLFLCADDHLPTLLDAGVALDLTGSPYAQTIQDANVPNSVLSVTSKEHIYGFPATNDNGFFLWYDGDALTEQQASTLEGIIEVCKTQTKKFLLNFGDGWYVPTVFFGKNVCGETSLQWSKDASGDVVYTVNWDNAAGVAACETMATLIQGNKAYYVAGGNDAVLSGFEDGELIAAVSGTWMEEDLSKIQGLNLQARALPTFGNGSQLGTFTGSKIYVVNAVKGGEDARARMQAAAALADALTNKAGQLKRYELRKAGPSNKEALADPAYTGNLSKGLKALNAQVALAAAVQYTSAEDKYWNVGAAIGAGIKDGDLGEFDTWQEFLTYQCDILRGIN
jgi:arabinogalactan oligomer/maltooligosaccharide transport system substrate-binding protein